MEDTMEEIKDIETAIEACLNRGYSLKDLKPADRRELDGFIWGIVEAENVFDNYCLEAGFGGIKAFAKIKKQVAEEIWEEFFKGMISSAVDLVYSIEDDYEDGDDND